RVLRLQSHRSAHSESDAEQIKGLRIHHSTCLSQGLRLPKCELDAARVCRGGGDSAAYREDEKFDLTCRAATGSNGKFQRYHHSIWNQFWRLVQTFEQLTSSGYNGLRQSEIL